MTKEERQQAAYRTAFIVAAALWHLERRNARAMLRAERETLLEARRAIREAGGEIADALHDASEHGPDATKERAIGRVQASMPALAAALAWALLSGRRKAREAASTVAAQEIQVLRLVEREAFTLTIKGASAADAAVAQVRASSIASSWGSAAIAKIEEALRPTAKSPKAAVAELTALVERRAERTVATEVANAFNEGKSEAYSEIAQEPWAAGMYRTWSAYLDSITCSYCWRKDGETVPLGQPFNDGMNPPAHPNCRCIITTAFVPNPAALEAIGWDYEGFKDEVLAELLEMKRGTRSTAPGGQRYAPAYIELAQEVGSPKALVEMLHRGDYLMPEGVMTVQSRNIWSHVVNLTREERERALSPRSRAIN